MKKEIARLLLQKGYITSYEIVEGEVQSKIVITLKYGPNGEKVINGLKRVSKPGLRIYAGHDELPKVLGGLGIAIISTPKGVMTDKEARKANHGGEVLAYIW
jgi:small subunit ribosomal protein S8